MVEETAVQDDVKEFLQVLAAISPASNKLTQMLVVFPERATTLYKLYPEIFEREEEVKLLLGFRYTSDGKIEVGSDTLSEHLRGIFLVLFKLLSNENTRRQILNLAGITEEQFREFDPLRLWLNVALDYVAKTHPEALRLLNTIVEKLSGKEPSSSISKDELKRAVKEVEDFEFCYDLLNKFWLTLRSGSWIYAYECPLLLDTYQDLREKLRELIIVKG